MKSLLFLFLIPQLIAATTADLKAGKFGKLLSENALVKTSSSCQHDTPETHLNLVSGPQVACAFHTDKESNPWVILKLEGNVEVCALEIINRQSGSGFREKNLIVWISENGKDWQEVWSAGGKEENSWIVTLTDKEGKGKKAAWVKLGTNNKSPEYFHLSRVNVYGQ